VTRNDAAAAGARAWYGGRTPPDPEILATAIAADTAPAMLYDREAGGTGEYASIFRTLYDRMDSLKRSPFEFRTWTEEDGIETFFGVLIDFAPSDLRGRVQFLQRLGTFKFRKMDGPEEKKAKIEAVFAPVEGEEDYHEQLRRQARRLAQVWGARPESLLEYIIARPAQVGRVLAERLNPTGERPLRLVGHAFAEVRSTLLRPLAEAKTVAYESQGEVHLVTAVRPVLERWDADAEGIGCTRVNLLEALLLHEVAEVVLDESEPVLEPLDAHIVASTFERYLKGQMLSVAVEDFFLDWPPLSSTETAEREAAEMAQQLEEMSAFMGEDAAPVEDDANLDGLPLDPDASAAPRKKVLVRKKVIVTKDGKRKIVKTRVVPREGGEGEAG
jgi:hypothetical protein